MRETENPTKSPATLTARSGHFLPLPACSAPPGEGGNIFQQLLAAQGIATIVPVVVSVSVPLGEVMHFRWQGRNPVMTHPQFSTVRGNMGPISEAHLA